MSQHPPLFTPPSHRCSIAPLVPPHITTYEAAFQRFAAKKAAIEAEIKRLNTFLTSNEVMMPQAAASEDAGLITARAALDKMVEETETHLAMAEIKLQTATAEVKAAAMANNEAGA